MEELFSSESAAPAVRKTAGTKSETKIEMKSAAHNGAGKKTALRLTGFVHFFKTCTPRRVGIKLESKRKRPYFNS
jgi:hypothetical protein